MLAILLVAGLSAAADHMRRGVDVGDHVTFHVTARDENGTVLYTTDPDLARAEIAAGRVSFPGPDERPAAYLPMEGYLRLSNGSNFDPVPFLLGRSEGETVSTPMMDSPVPARPDEVLPLVLDDVGIRFWADRDDVAEEPSAVGLVAVEGLALYAETFPVRILDRNETSVEVEMVLTPGQVIPSRRMDVDLEVESVDDDSADLRLLVAEGDVLNFMPCAALALGLDVGRYVVRSLNETAAVLAPHTPRDALVGNRLSFEFTVLEIKEWPELYWLQVEAERTYYEGTRALTSLLAHDGRAVTWLGGGS